MKKGVIEAAKRLGLTAIETSNHIREHSVLIFALNKKSAAESRKDEIIRQLENTYGVKLVGPVVSHNKLSASFLTRQIIVKFKSEIVKDEIPGIARALDCELIRPITYLEMDGCLKL